MSFHTLNYPSHVLGNLKNKHKPLYKARKTPVLAVPPSSVILQTDESDNKPDSTKNSGSVSSSSRNSLLTQHNAVGIIGGVSVDSTLNFVKKLVKLHSEGEEDRLPFVLCSDPALNKELLCHERSSFSFTWGKNEILQPDQTAIVENLRRKRTFLERSGACCIVMPCHISHSWHDEVSKGCSVPMLHMGECVAKELKEAKLRPLEAGSPLRIGVLATDATLKAGFYQEELQKEGFEVVLPDKATMEHTVIPSIEAMTRKDIEGARTLLRIALQVLLVRAVNTVILASDDMRQLLPRDDPLLKKCIDPMDALARSTVKFAQSDERGCT